MRQGKIKYESEQLIIGDNLIATIAKQGKTETEIAYGKEIVRRWNAFEDGGIVEELRKVCEELMERADDGSADFDDPAPGSIFTRAAAIIEAALAKI